MANTFLGKAIEFLIGLMVLPTLIGFVFTFVVLQMGYSEEAITNMILPLGITHGILIVITFFVRKPLAIGYALGTIGYFIATLGVISGLI